MQRYLLIALGGGLGSMLRFYVGSVAAHRFGPRFPVGTLFINFTACVLLGASLEFFDHYTQVSPAWRSFLPTGFIGGHSTFSTFEWEAWADFASHDFRIGLLYLLVSVAGGLFAVSLGTALVRRAA